MLSQKLPILLKLGRHHEAIHHFKTLVEIYDDQLPSVEKLSWQSIHHINNLEYNNHVQHFFKFWVFKLIYKAISGKSQYLEIISSSTAFMLLWQALHHLKALWSSYCNKIKNILKCDYKNCSYSMIFCISFYLSLPLQLLWGTIRKQKGFQNLNKGSCRRKF